MATHLRVYSPSGTLLGRLPEHAGFTYQVELNGPGSIRGSYPRNGKNAALLDSDDAVIAIVENGVEKPERYVLEDDGEDKADPAVGSRLVEFSGRGFLALFERARVYPIDHTPGMTGAALYNLRTYHDFGARTPGYIMRVLIQRAQARGALTGITWDFTDTLDSSGAAWVSTYTVKYDAGVDYLTILTAMADNGWVDLRMNGTVLQLFKPGTTLGTVRPDVVLRNGREVTQGPRKRSRTPIRSHILGIGDEGAITESVNPSTATAFGRREGYDGRGGITDVGTLQALTDSALTSATKPSEGFTLVYDLAAGGPQPFTAYGIGDFITWDQRRLSDASLEPLRVRTIAVEYTQGGSKGVSIEVNDLFVEREIKLKRKVEGITGGSSSNNRAPVTPDTDTSTPGDPISVTISSLAYQVDATDEQRVTATISWPTVTVNADATPYVDAKGYEIQWRLSDASTTWGPASSVPNAVTSVQIPGLPPGANMVARVRTIDINDNASGWTSSSVTALVGPSGPAAPPSTPTTTQIAAGLRVYWNGLNNAAAPYNLDFAGVEVHVSSVSAAFTPDATTLRDFLTTDGYASITGLTVGTTYWVKFVGVDRYGQVSAASAAGPGGGVTVRGANDGEIADVSVSKLTAGVLLADMTTSARIKTKDSRTGTYTWAGGLITVTTAQPHGLSTGNSVYLDITSGAAVDGSGTATVLNATQFTIIRVGSGTGGNVTAWLNTVSQSRVEIDSNGIKAYNSTGVNTVTISGSTASIDAGIITGTTFTGGLFRTAASGSRIEMNSAYSTGQFYLYTGFGSPAEDPGSFTDSSPAFIGTFGDATERILQVYSPSVGGGKAGIELRGKATTGDVGGNGVEPRIFLWAGSRFLSVGYWSNVFGSDNTDYFGIHREDRSYMLMTHVTAGHVYLSSAVGANLYLRANGGDSAGRVDMATTQFLAEAVHSQTTTNAGNVYVSSSPAGKLWRSTSSLRYKIAVEDHAPDPAALLGLRLVTWFDRLAAERYADALTEGEVPEDEHPVRIPGVIAEEIHDAGLGEFVTYDLDGRPDGVKYDRLALAWIPLIKHLVKANNLTI
jgi:hypothetical protein